MTPHRDKKVPYIETKVAKRPPHSEKGPLYSKKRKIFQGRERSPSLAPPPPAGAHATPLKIKLGQNNFSF